MSYSEGGPSNGQISQRLTDTGLNHSASIPMLSGDQPVQLQGSHLMRVSHSWTPHLNILEISKHLWPASEPCRQANIKDMDCIFPVRAPPSFMYPPCKYEGMVMHSWSTVVCQIWGQFRWNLVLYGSKCPILKGVHQTARPPKRLIDTGLNHSGSIPIW